MKSVARRLPLIVILCISLVLRLWGIGFGLPQRYHIDEPPYVLAALRIATGDFHITYPYNSPNIFQFMLTGLYGAWFGAGWVVGLFNSPTDLAALYESDPSGFFLIARGLVALLSTVTVALLYLLGKRLGGKLEGLLAAALLAVAFGHAREAHYAVTDTLIAGLVVASLFSIILYVDSTQFRYLALAGVFGGAAIGLKYLPAPILLPLMLAHYYRRKPFSNRSVKEWAIELSALGACSLLGFLLAFPAPVLDPKLFQIQWHQVWEQASGVLGNIEVTSYPLPVYYLKTLDWGVGMAVLVSAGLGIALWFREQRPVRFALILVFAVAYLVAISSVQTGFARYALPMIPILTLLAAKPIATVIRLLQRRVADQRVAWLVGVLLFLMVGIIPASRLFRHNVLLGKTDTRTLARDWIEANVPPGKTLAVQWYGPALSEADDPEPGSTQIYEVISLSPFEMRESAYELDTYRGSGVAYVVVNSWNKGFRHQDARQNQLRSQFYTQLESEAQRVAVFRPTSAVGKIPFVFEQIYGPYTMLWQVERPGPEVEVFALDDQ